MGKIQREGLRQASARLGQPEEDVGDGLAVALAAHTAENDGLCLLLPRLQIVDTAAGQNNNQILCLLRELIKHLDLGCGQPDIRAVVALHLPAVGCTHKSDVQIGGIDQYLRLYALLCRTLLAAKGIAWSVDNLDALLFGLGGDLLEGNIHRVAVHKAAAATLHIGLHRQRAVDMDALMCNLLQRQNAVVFQKNRALLSHGHRLGVQLLHIQPYVLLLRFGEERHAQLAA